MTNVRPLAEPAGESMMGDENNLRGRPRKGKSKSDLILEKIYVADSDVGQLAPKQANIFAIFA